MISDADVKKLKETFATKEELADLQVDMGDQFHEVNEKLDRITVVLDGVAGAIQDLRTENGAGAAHLRRHDRQIAALAEHASVTLPS